PLPLLLASLVAITAPIAWLFFQIYQLRQENLALAERNSDLSTAASEVVEELDQLDAEIDRLEERAGIPDSEMEREPTQNPRGGISMQLGPEEMLAAAEHHLPSLSLRLHRQVKPALTDTLAEEETKAAAMPVGIPVKDSRISSKFGMRSNPFGRGYELHNGIDFKGAMGTPIYATGSGTVETAVLSRGYGNHVIVDHGYGYKTVYAHLSRMAVSAGDTVDRGTVVGNLGSTGRSTGPHLHYSVYYHGDAVDPQDFLGSSPQATD
ncbi:MAG: M23 family metallopeptidase, partial [Elainellaceae cyanobacterium]